MGRFLSGDKLWPVGGHGADHQLQLIDELWIYQNFSTSQSWQTTFS